MSAGYERLALLLRTIERAAAVAPARPNYGAGYTGDLCLDCGSPRMIRTGTCLTCLDCGSASGGCS